MKNIYYIILALILLSGCSDAMDIFREDGSHVILELNLFTPGQVASRAISEGEEYNIHDMEILMFGVDGAEADKLIGRLPASQLAFTSPGEIQSVKVALDPSFLNRNVCFVLLANLEENYDISTLDLTTGRDKSAILNDLKFSLPERWNARLGSSSAWRTFPMYGSIVVPLNSLLLTKTVFMLRSLARVQFFVNDGAGLTYDNGGNQEELFHMSSLRVYFSRKGGYVAPLVPFENTDKSISTPSQPEDFLQRAVDDPLVYTIDNTEKNAYLRTVYLPENDNISPSGTDMPIKMVIGGHYKGSSTETFYKVEFKDTPTEVLYDCLRNYTYDFNITDVTEAGKSTPIDALNSDAQLVIKVTPWDEANVSAADLTLYELTVSQSMVVVDSKSQSVDIDVTTTYEGDPDPKHWSYDAGSDVGNSEHWFTVTETSTGLLITFLTNATTEDRLGSFTISSGLLTKRINLSQSQQKTSNCYLVAEEGLHGLYALNMGNGPYGNDDGLAASLNAAAPTVYNADATINRDAIQSARLIWQSRPGLISKVGPETGALLTDDGMLAYEVGAPLPGELGGNAVIGIFDKDDKVIWSWHIWIIWGYNSEEHDLHFLTSGVRSGFYFQDRNLGAMQNVVGTANSYGLLYQWGRKDPMRSTNDVVPPYSFTTTYSYSGTDTDPTSYDNSSEWHAWSGGTAFTTILASIQNPMNISAGWGQGGDSKSLALWGNPNGATVISGTASKTDATTARYNGTQVWNEGKKSIFDPCPLGYRVPSLNGFYFGMGLSHAMCVSEKGTGNIAYPYSYVDLDGLGTSAHGYLIYYFGQYKNYEKYYTWMPMTPYYVDGDPNKLVSPTEGSEGFAYTWLNAPYGAGSGQVVGWHPVNHHIHAYGKYGTTANSGGTVRCIRETDTKVVSVTMPNKVALLPDAGSTMSFAVMTELNWHIETNNLTYDWVSAVRNADGTVTVSSIYPNLSAEERVAYIYICLSNGDKQAVKVIQEGVSLGVDNVQLSYNSGASKTTVFDVPVGGKVALPGGGSTYSDGRFSYTLSHSGQTYTLVTTTLVANETPTDEHRTLNLTISAEDGSNPSNLAVDVVQSKYTIGEGKMTLPATLASTSISFVLPAGSTGTPSLVIGGVDVGNTGTGTWGTYKLTSKTGKGVTTYTLTGTSQYVNFGTNRNETVQVKIGSSLYDVQINQASCNPFTVTSIIVTKNTANVNVQLTPSTEMKTCYSQYTWSFKDPDEFPSWLTLNPTFTAGNNPMPSAQFIIGTTNEKNATGAQREGTIELELTNTVTGESFVVILPIVQNK